MPLLSPDLRKPLLHEEWQLLILGHHLVEEANVHFAFAFSGSLSNNVKLFENPLQSARLACTDLDRTANQHPDSIDEIYVSAGGPAPCV